MEILTIFFIALALAMDAFAVSIVSGSIYEKLGIKHTLKIASFFGGFQAFMPLLGLSAAITTKKYIQNFDHWVAFIILMTIGLKMIYESFKIKTEGKNFDITNTGTLLILSVATSIDALAVGITLPLITKSVFFPALVIGIVTFILSCFGVYIGKRIGHFFESKIEAIGGIILIFIGLKILIQHIF
jgi:putative Mn2+ efflux pump MntP